MNVFFCLRTNQELLGLEALKFILLFAQCKDYFLQNDVDLIHEIEAVLGKQLEKFDCKENEVLDDISKVRQIPSFPLFENVWPI